ncbi:hypothetical protein [Streptomyces sp. NPDC001652]|uniref:hypothetical protein n=1 Tax=Streptomyces sp. NPDC001652 TaxID=3154393 RepID=UPI00331710A5
MSQERENPSDSPISDPIAELAAVLGNLGAESQEQFLRIYNRKIEAQVTTTRWSLSVALLLGTFGLGISLLLALRGDPIPCLSVAGSVMLMFTVVAIVTMGRTPEKAVLKALRAPSPIP